MNWRLFWAKVEKQGPWGCWVWTGERNEKGYGCYWNRELGTRLAHRLAYIASRGAIPAGLTLDHLCRNRACVNPDHLEPVTRKVNILRGVGICAIEKRRTHCIKGHPFAGDNLYLRPTGGRRCKACAQAAKRRQAARKKEARWNSSHP